MIEETAWVISTEDEYAIVETERKSACQSCSVNKGCGTGALSKVLGKKTNRLRVLNPVGATENQQVIVGLAEEALVKGSLAVYVVPLVAMLGSAMFASLLGGAETHELWIILSAFLGLAIGFAWVRRFSIRIADDARYQPIILRDAGCAASTVQIKSI